MRARRAPCRARRFDGIFGLDFTTDGTATPGDMFSHICAANRPAMRCCFAMFLSRHDNAKGSQLTIGGYDSRKVLPGAAWQYSAVVPTMHYQRSLTMWATAVTGIHVAGSAAMPLGATACAGAGNGCVALIDSGTSYLG